MRSAVLKGKRVLVTGASSGIGRSIARAFLRVGAIVVGTGRVNDELLKVPQTDGDIARFMALPGDLRSFSFVEELAQSAGDVDVLVNCAGILKHAPFLDSDPLDWEEAFAVNVLATLAITQRVGVRMASRKTGHVINISSTRAEDVAPMTLAYSATKAAIRAFSKGLREELRPYGIRVTEIAPGFTESNIRRSVTHSAAVSQFEQSNFTPLTSDEVASAVVYAAQAPVNCSTDLLVLRPFGQA